MKRILLFLLLVMPLAINAQKSYAHIYLTDGLKINESFQNGPLCTSRATSPLG